MVTRRVQAVKDDSEHEATGFLGPLFDVEMDREGTGVTSKIVLKPSRVVRFRRAEDASNPEKL